MSVEVNAAGQPLGFPVDGWRPPPRPPLDPITGRTCRVEPLDVARHAVDLHAANLLDGDGRNWTYLPYGPFTTLGEYTAWLTGMAGKDDPQFYAIVASNGVRPLFPADSEKKGSDPVFHAVGVASYLRIDPAAGSIEVGHINYSPRLQRTVASTEAMYLMMQRAFGLGYRRYEWKCNALNAPSRAAAQRLGFSYEGVFRQAMVVKGRNRDTAWYAMIDREWPAIDRALQRWLDPVNFDAEGRQRTSLSELTRPILIQRG